MCERYGLFLMDPENNLVGSSDVVDTRELAQTLLKQSMWAYLDWGALGKVNQLRKTHDFLKGARRSTCHPSALMSFIFAAEIDSTTKSERTSHSDSLNSMVDWTIDVA